MLKQNALRSCCAVMALLAIPGASALEAISDLNLQSISGASDSFATTPPAGISAPFDNPAQTWTATADGGDQKILSVDVPTGLGNTDETYEVVRLAGELRLRRIDNANVTGIRDLVFCRGNPIGSPTFEIP